ncbi:MAG: transposase [Oligoflexia bacterium]|nr:transposase [Oligoflexia bacterium]
MGNPIRNTDPSLIHLITLRTEGACLWLVPSTELNQMILGVLARYQEMFGVVIHAYTFLSNHPHLLLRAPRGNLDEFMENVAREIARRANYHSGRKGKFWSRRYSDQIVLSEEGALEAFLYVTTNSTRHGLVKHCKDWPGVCSYNQCLDGQDRECVFIHYSKRDYIGSGNFVRSKHILKLAPLPQHAGLSQGERAVILKKLIDERCQFYVAKRNAAGEGFLGVAGILKQRLGGAAMTTANSPRPTCYKDTLERMREFRRQARERRCRHREASIRFRFGDYSVQFPPFSYKPPSHRRPRDSDLQQLGLCLSQTRTQAVG